MNLKFCICISETTISPFLGFLPLFLKGNNSISSISETINISLQFVLVRIILLLLESKKDLCSHIVMSPHPLHARVPHFASDSDFQDGGSKQRTYLQNWIFFTKKANIAFAFSQSSCGSTPQHILVRNKGSGLREVYSLSIFQKQNNRGINKIF